MCCLEAKFIDIHAHLLPGVDDGARTIEEAMELVSQSINQGFSSIVVTPHYSRNYSPKDFLKQLEILRSEVLNHYPDFKIYAGQEIHYHQGLIEKLKDGSAFTINHSRYVLLEFSNEVAFSEILRAIRRLNDAGYIPVLAHVERYQCLKESAKMKEIYHSGCLLQMNYESITGLWFQSEVRRCRKLVESGMIHVFGTDIHRVDYRNPEVSRARKWLFQHLRSEVFENVTFRNAEHIINNKELGWIKHE